MLFRNVTFYRFHPEDIGYVQGLGAIGVGTDAARDPGPMEFGTAGWTSPRGINSPDLVADVHNEKVTAFVLALSFRERLLPAAVVHECVRLAIREIEENESRRVGFKERRQIKETAISQLLPQAFVRSSTVRLMIEPAKGWLAIDTSSRARAESVVNHLRTTFGSFRCQPLAARDSARAAMTTWLIDGGLDKFNLGDETDLRDPAEHGSTVAIRRADLGAGEIDEHLRGGKQCVRVGLVCEDRDVSFTLADDLVIRKLKFGQDYVAGELNDAEGEGDGEATAEDRARLEFDTLAFLLHAELSQILADLDHVIAFADLRELPLDGGDAAPETKRSEKLARQLGNLSDAEFEAKMQAAFERHPGHLAAINELRAARRAGKALDFANDAGVISALEGESEAAKIERVATSPGVRAAVRKMAKGVKKHGVSVTISSVTDGKVDRSTTIDQKAADNIIRNTNPKRRK